MRLRNAFSTFDMKDRIKRNFSRASLTYNQHDDVQKKAAAMLVSKTLQNCEESYNFNMSSARILDVGCGTGNVIAQLHEHYPQAFYAINDISHAMLQKTMNALGAIDIVEAISGDIEVLKLEHDYDLIVSNMCLQWVNDLEVVIQKLLKHTRILAFSCLLHGSFDEWHDLLQKYGVLSVPKIYRSQAQVASYITKACGRLMHSSQENCSVKFDNARGAMKHLQGIGANASDFSVKNLANVRRLWKESDQSCSLQYNLGFFIARGDVV